MEFERNRKASQSSYIKYSKVLSTRNHSPNRSARHGSVALPHRHCLLGLRLLLSFSEISLPVPALWDVCEAVKASQLGATVSLQEQS